MAKWFYYNENNEKIEVTGGQLKGLAKAGVITPETMIETEDGKTAPARRVKGLTFVETSQLETLPPAPPAPAKPRPSIATAPVAAAQPVVAAPLDSTSTGTPSTGSLWMHWAFPFIPILSLIIWTVIRNNDPHANTHGKHILNAFCSLFIRRIVLGIVLIGNSIAVGIIINEFVGADDEFVPMLISGIISLLLLVYAIFVEIRAIVSAIKIGTAAGNGEVVPYKWAMCFFKTDQQSADTNDNNYSSQSKTGVFVFLGLIVFGTIIADGFIYYYSRHKAEVRAKEYAEKQERTQREFDERDERMRRESEQEKQRKIDEANAAKQAAEAKFLEAIEKAEKVPVFTGSSITQLPNAKAVFGSFIEYGTTFRSDKLPEPYRQSGNSGSVSSDIVLLEGTKFIFIGKTDYKLILDTLRKSKFDQFDPRAKDDVLRNYSIITGQGSRFRSNLIAASISAHKEQQIEMALTERGIIYNITKSVPTEKQGVFDVFLQAGFGGGQPCGVMLSDNFIRFYCNGSSPVQKKPSFSIRMFFDINVSPAALRAAAETFQTTGKRVPLPNRTTIEISTDGESPLGAQSFRVSNGGETIFDSGNVRFTESENTFGQRASLTLVNKDRDAILEAIYGSGESGFIFYGSDDRSRRSEMEPEHRERFKQMRELIQVIEQ